MLGQLEEFFKELGLWDALVGQGLVLEGKMVDKVNVVYRKHLEGWSPDVKEDWKDKMRKWIKEEAKVPRYVTSMNGSRYMVDMPDKKAVMLFKKMALSGKVDMDRLALATKKYYSDVNLARVTISNFFGNEVWKSVYDDAESAGSTQDLVKLV